MAFLILLVVGVVGVVAAFASDELRERDTAGPAARAADYGGPLILLLFVFLAALGGLGFLGDRMGWPWPGSALFGAAGAALICAASYAFILVPAREAEAEYAAAESPEHIEGRVTAAIPAFGVGRVKIATGANWRRLSHAARTADGQPLARGSAVRVVGHEGGTLIVAAVSEWAEEETVAGGPAGE